MKPLYLQEEKWRGGERGGKGMGRIPPHLLPIIQSPS